MDGWGSGLAALDAVLREVTLVAGAGFLVGGVDDLAVDFAYLIHRLYRRRLAPPAGGIAEPLAILVPAWDESAVIGRMLRHMLARFGPRPFDLLVGCYPNDPATIAEAESVAACDPRVRVVIGPRPGPTTKADNLNVLWRALRALEEDRGWRAGGVVLHDAEDLVHPEELDAFARLLGAFDLVQLPVLPLVVKGSPLVSGHYADEFAESHSKTLVVRESVGAALPLAGTGCAIARDMIGRIAGRRDGAPFDADSLTEDYELGLHVGSLAGRATFARLKAADGGLIAVRACFPDRFDAAVRQKARWMTGIALAGWDRVGWGRWHAVTDHWMRARDRRALLAMVILFFGWLALLLSGAAGALHWLAGRPMPMPGGWIRIVLATDATLLLWRVVMRMAFTGRFYGPAQAILAPLRMIVGNAIMLCAARRAVVDYLRMLRGAAPVWAKTDHVFPEDAV